MSRWIIRMNQDDCPCSLRNSPFEFRKVNPPTEILKQWVRMQTHVIKVGQEIEQRVAWLSYQHGIARIAQQTEEKAVGLAGARGQDNVVGINLSLMSGVVPGDRLTGNSNSPGVRIIGKRIGIAKRPENGFGIEREATHRGVGDRKIEDFETLYPAFADRLRQRPLGCIPRCSL